MFKKYQNSILIVLSVLTFVGVSVATLMNFEKISEVVSQYPQLNISNLTIVGAIIVICFAVGFAIKQGKGKPVAIIASIIALGLFGYYNYDQVTNFNPRFALVMGGSALFLMVGFLIIKYWDDLSTKTALSIYAVLGVFAILTTLGVLVYYNIIPNWVPPVVMGVFLIGIGLVKIRELFWKVLYSKYGIGVGTIVALGTFVYYSIQNGFDSKWAIGVASFFGVLILLAVFWEELRILKIKWTTPALPGAGTGKVIPFIKKHWFFLLVSLLLLAGSGLVYYLPEWRYITIGYGGGLLLGLITFKTIGCIKRKHPGWLSTKAKPYFDDKWDKVKLKSKKIYNDGLKNMTFVTRMVAGLIFFIITIVGIVSHTSFGYMIATIAPLGVCWFIRPVFLPKVILLPLSIFWGGLWIYYMVVGI